jgi:hypothetical protein
LKVVAFSLSTRPAPYSRTKSTRLVQFLALIAWMQIFKRVRLFAVSLEQSQQFANVFEQRPPHMKALPSLPCGLKISWSPGVHRKITARPGESCGFEIPACPYGRVYWAPNSLLNFPYWDILRVTYQFNVIEFIVRQL